MESFLNAIANGIYNMNHNNIINKIKSIIKPNKKKSTSSSTTTSSSFSDSTNSKYSIFLYFHFYI